MCALEGWVLLSQAERLELVLCSIQVSAAAVFPMPVAIR
jgi:hypothetical protein